MGKYIRKAKTTWEVAVMEVTQSSLGVRTRAKTLALQRLKKSTTTAPAATPPTPTATATSTSTTNSSGSYLQLRNRRLEKPPSHHNSKRQKQSQRHNGGGCLQNPSSSHANSRASSRLRIGGSAKAADSVSGEDGLSVKDDEKVVVDATKEEEVNNNVDSGIEASFGENVLDLEGRERSTRESTPCSLIRNPDTIRTPGSTTRPTSSPENRRTQNSAQRNIPTAHEMDEFFAAAEEEEQRQFIEKYNFDPVNDKPLPGRYEWVKLDP